MKACPYCAEQIQDAAVVCKHCNRNVSRPQAKKQTSKGLYGSAILLALIVVVAGAFSIVHARISSQQAAAQQHAADVAAAQRARDSIAAVTPTVQSLIDKQNYAIAAHGYLFDEITTGQQSHCSVVGNVAGSGDGVETLLLPYGQMVAWQANPQAATAMWRSGLSTNAVVEAALPDGAGHYVVVVANTKAWLFPHRVNAKLSLKCTRSWPPAAL
jgi:hypothetical protein